MDNSHLREESSPEKVPELEELDIVKSLQDDEVSSEQSSGRPSIEYTNVAAKKKVETMQSDWKREAVSTEEDNELNDPSYRIIAIKNKFSEHIKELNRTSNRLAILALI